MKRFKGSLTVEAALVFPMVIFAVIALIFIIIYLHDATCLKTIVNETAEKMKMDINKQVSLEGNILSPTKKLSNGLYWRFNKENHIYIEQKVSKYIKKEVEEQLILNEHDNVVISTSINNDIIKQTLVIEVKKNVSTSIGIINQMLNNDDIGLNISVKSTIDLTESVEVIRMINFLNDTSDSIVGLKDLRKELYDKVDNVKRFFEY